MALYSRGLAWFQKGRWDNAINDFSKTLALDPQNAGAYYNRGLAWGKKGNKAKAKADFQAATRLDRTLKD